MKQLEVFRDQIRLNEKRTYFGLDDKLIDEIGDLVDKCNELSKQKQELISYLKNQIDICDGCIDVMTSDLKEIMSGRAGKTYLTSEIFKNEIAKECYQDILNKIEKRDK